MTLLGRTWQDLPFTVCDQFQPTVLEGQLCYKLEPNKTKTIHSKTGKKYSLLVILEQEISTQKQYVQHDTEFDKNKMVKYINMEYEKPKADSARIYIHTLSQGMLSHFGYRTGSYGMSSLKKMSGTARFLQLPEDTIGCKLETFEERNTNLFIEQVQAQCGCVPWALTAVVKLKVNCYQS